ncbi:MAG TPA: hypothetical protein VG603_14685 [Chitinophagales bacterium]|nr:hypothetical protein [Chitinophagales bacterium]
MLLLFFSGFLPAQNDSVFLNMKKVETTDYTFSIPEKWKKTDQLDVSTKDIKFDASGVGLPLQYNNANLSATFTLRKIACDSLRTAEDFVISEQTSYPDRTTPAGQNYVTDTFTLKSGEKGHIIFTHYYRRSRQSNFATYILLAYSKKRKAAYCLTMVYQFTDPTYGIEEKLGLKKYAGQVFKTLVLR